MALQLWQRDMLDVDEQVPADVLVPPHPDFLPLLQFFRNRQPLALVPAQHLTPTFWRRMVRQFNHAPCALFGVAGTDALPFRVTTDAHPCPAATSWLIVANTNLLQTWFPQRGVDELVAEYWHTSFNRTQPHPTYPRTAHSAHSHKSDPTDCPPEFVRTPANCVPETEGSGSSEHRERGT